MKKVHVFAVLFLFTQLMSAQPYITVQDVDYSWPNIKVKFVSSCDGIPNYDYAPSSMTIFEDNIEVWNSPTVLLPDTSMPCPYSVSFVIDASGSMVGSGNAMAKSFFHGFIDQMNGINDEASVMFSGNIPFEQQVITISKPALHSAIDALPASGTDRHTWDAVYAAIERLALQGQHPTKAIVLFTNSIDNGSARTFSDVQKLANSNRVRIFCAYYENGGGSDFENIAMLTGGRFIGSRYAPDLYNFVGDVLSILKPECWVGNIEYTNPCKDGKTRAISVTIDSICGARLSSNANRTYTAILDSSSFEQMQMSIGNIHASEDTEVRLPIAITSNVSSQWFYPLSFDLLFDDVYLEYIRVEGVGELQGKIPISTAFPGGVSIELDRPDIVNRPGEIFHIIFRTATVNNEIFLPVSARGAAFDRGCNLPVINPGSIRINKHIPIVSCDIDAPKELVWQRGIKDYTPNPFPVLMRIYNTGDKEATNVRYRINYNASDVQLVSPWSDVQTGTPKDLQAGEFAEVMWQVAAKRRTSGDSTEFCITASFDNHEDVICCVKVYIPPTEPILECTIDVPVISVNAATGKYDPMPFPVTVSVTNSGGMPTKSVSALILLPRDLQLSGPDAPDNNRKPLQPETLSPQASGTVQWLMHHPETTTEKQYVIQVWVKTSNADSTLCEKTVTIPALQNIMTARITPEGPTTFCDGKEVVLDAGAGFSSYSWSTGATTQKITITASGSYWVTVGNSTGQSAKSDTVTVNVLPLPPKPAVTRQGDILLADNAATWQWLRDGNLIAGETKQFFAITNVGTYSVRVTNAEGCQNTSDPIIVSVLTLEEVAPLSFSFDVYPEPSYGNLYVRISSSDEAPMDIHIYTLLGSERYTRAIRPIRGSGIHEIDTRGWTKGVYFVRVKRGSQSIIRAVSIR